MVESRRRLAAIMFTDIVGYSAITQRNESLALALLDEHNILVRAAIAAHAGREIKTVGDAFLAEFDSALEAVRCAIRIQSDLNARNGAGNKARKQANAESNAESNVKSPIEIRIGIHLGDVVYRENDVFGDGVNIAARVQSTAGAGEVRLSEDVARQVANKIDYPLDDLGPIALKNIEQVVRIFSVKLPWVNGAEVVDGSASEGKNAPMAKGHADTAPVGEFGALSKDRHSRAGGNPAALNDGNATRQQTRPRRMKLLITAGFGLAIAAALLWVQPWKTSSIPQSTGGSSKASPEIKQLVAQVEDLIRDPMTATRESYVLADELMQRVLKAENNNTDYWVLAARISQMLVRQAYDLTAQKMQLLNEQIEKAATLSPDAIAVKELITRQQFMSGKYAEATRLATEILAKDPVNRVALSVRGEIARGEGRWADAAEASAALQKLPGGDPLSLLFETLQLARAARLYEAEKAFNQLLAVSPTRIAFFAKMEFVKDYLADPLSAAAYVAQIPERYLQQESLGAIAAHAFILSGRGDDALALLNRIPRDFLSEFAINDPKGLFTGSAHEVAGRPAAAAAEWRNALALVEKRLAADANNLSLLSSKAILQSMLGQKNEALETLRLRTELGAKNRPPVLVTRTHVLVRCGKESAAIEQIRTEWGKTSFYSRSLLVGDLAHMPIYAKVRQDKTVASLIAEHYAFIKAARVAPSAPSVASAPATKQ